MEYIILFAILISAYLIVMAKRMAALIRNFVLQSLSLALFTLILGIREHSAGLFFIAGILFILKACVIPFFLNKISKKIKVNENLGMFMNAQLSLFCGLFLTYLSFVFSWMIMPQAQAIEILFLTISFSIISTGIFITMFRMKAIAQIIGILIMENGIFLLGVSISGGMPFLLEIGLFLDVFVSVIILNIFVYRINKMFTHIDIHKLTSLKG